MQVITHKQIFSRWPFWFLRSATAAVTLPWGVYYNVKHIWYRNRDEQPGLWKELQWHEESHWLKMLSVGKCKWYFSYFTGGAAKEEAQAKHEAKEKMSHERL